MLEQMSKNKVLLLFLSLIFLNTYNLSANSNLPPCEGEDHEKYTNCYGKYIGKQYNEDGFKWLSDYEGEFGKLPGLAHGYGKAKNYSFDPPQYDEEYEGDFKNDLADGQGTYTIAIATYTGGWKEGQRHGYGEETVKNELENSPDKYSGKWNQDTLKKGVKTYSANGKYYKYDGEFNSDFEFHGDGVITTLNSELPYILTARFKNGTPNGKGEIFFTNEKISYKGNWTSWDFPEKGLITQPDGQTYRGEIKDWEPVGKGVFLDANGKPQSFWNENKELAKQEIERERRENQRQAEEQRIKEIYVKATKLSQRVSRCYVKYSLYHFGDFLDAIDNYKRIGDYDGMIYLSQKFLGHPQVPGDC